MRKAEAAAHDIRSAGGNAAACVVDLADGARLQRDLPELTAEFGPPDILVNNAGISAMVRAEECSLEQWHKMIAINVTAPMLLMQYALPHMKKKGGGEL